LQDGGKNRTIPADADASETMLPPVRSAFMTWDKMDIIKYLSKLRDYRTYLEICTPTTGTLYAKIDPSRFDVCHRLMYQCPQDFSDGLKIDFRAADLDIGSCLADIERGGFRYDVILVDPWHEYEASLRDMQAALSLLTDHGSIVIHDCFPPTDDIISPEFVPGSWCGVTFIAYADFVMQNPGLQYQTIDTDFGCGIVRRDPDSSEPNRPVVFRDRWNSAKSSPAEAFKFMQMHQYSLLGLGSLDRFIRTEAESALWS
jgi:hypothetical protein